MIYYPLIILEFFDKQQSIEEKLTNFNNKSRSTSNNRYILGLETESEIKA